MHHQEEFVYLTETIRHSNYPRNYFRIFVKSFNGCGGPYHLMHSDPWSSHVWRNFSNNYYKMKLNNVRTRLNLHLYLFVPWEFIIPQTELFPVEKKTFSHDKFVSWNLWNPSFLSIWLLYTGACQIYYLPCISVEIM